MIIPAAISAVVRSNEARDVQATLEALAIVFAELAKHLAARAELVESWWAIATPRAEADGEDAAASDEPEARKGVPERATAGAHVRRLLAQIMGPILRAAVAPKADRDRFVAALARLASPALLVVEASKVRRADRRWSLTAQAMDGHVYMHGPSLTASLASAAPVSSVTEALLELAAHSAAASDYEPIVAAALAHADELASGGKSAQAAEVLVSLLCRRRGPKLAFVTRQAVIGRVPAVLAAVLEGESTTQAAKLALTALLALDEPALMRHALSILDHLRQRVR